MGRQRFSFPSLNCFSLLFIALHDLVKAMEGGSNFGAPRFISLPNTVSTIAISNLGTRLTALDPAKAKDATIKRKKWGPKSGTPFLLTGALFHILERERSCQLFDYFLWDLVSGSVNGALPVHS